VNTCDSIESRARMASSAFVGIAPEQVDRHVS
jgi:hypothetical protein